jgi:hypothetical protein
MDTLGLLLVAIAVLAYFLVRKSSPKLIPWLAFLGGVGAGLVAAAAYVFSVMSQLGL